MGIGIKKGEIKEEPNLCREGLGEWGSGDFQCRLDGLHADRDKLSKDSHPV